MSVAQAQTILEKIRTRGYWRVVIRPGKFEENHVRHYADLFSIVEKNSVRFRGWSYPHINDHRPSLFGPDWVGQEFDCQDELEVWRLYMSGQFAHLFAIAGEWQDFSEARPPEPGWKPGQYNYYLQTIYSFVEIFEFAARLALSPAGATSMRVDIEIEGLADRQIIETDNRFRFGRAYVSQVPNWRYPWAGSQPDLIARPRNLAADAAKDFFARFGLDVSIETLTKLQAAIGN